VAITSGSSRLLIGLAYEAGHTYQAAHTANNAVNRELTWAAICSVAAEGFPVAVTIWATDNPLQNSGRDCQPPVEGLRFAVLFPKPQWCTEAFALGWLLLAILVNWMFTIPYLGRWRRSAGRRRSSATTGTA
jgi:hypothetical protein